MHFFVSILTLWALSPPQRHLMLRLSVYLGTSETFGMTRRSRAYPHRGTTSRQASVGNATLVSSHPVARHFVA